MIARIVAVVAVLFSGMALAEAPATRPARVSSAATRPVSLSPKDLIRQLQEHQQKQKDLLKVAYIDLDEPLAEKPAEFALFNDGGLTLESVINRLRQAKGDKDLKAVLVNLGDTEIKMAQAQEIRGALQDLNRAGKRTFVYADSFDTAGYIAATGASDICMLGGGEIMMPGVSLETMFAKGLLDKVGVQADYVQIGEYKGADEMFTRTEPSKEVREEMNKVLDALYDQVVDNIAASRKISKEQVQKLIDQAILSGKDARQGKLVDHLVDKEGLRDLLDKQLGHAVDVVHDYGEPKREEIDWSNPFALLSMLSKKPKAPEKPAVAVIYVDGMIVDGEGESGLLGGSGTVGSEDIRKAMRIASRDDNVEAIVLRIDSPGGSAVASEAMWQAVHRVAEDKPVIVSVGGMAASGGYYVASAGDRIYADPSAIVGSIGVVGGKFVLKDLLDKVGVSTETFSRGRNAGLFSSTQPFTEQQRTLVTNWMQQTYQQFTERVMLNRRGKIKDIDQVARGRIFLARQAKDLGLVDELGGISSAIQYAAKESGMEEGEYEIRVIPATRTLADLLSGDKAETKMPFQPKMTLGTLDILKSLDRSSAGLVHQQLQVLRLLQARPVILVSPYVLTLR